MPAKAGIQSSQNLNHWIPDSIFGNDKIKLTHYPTTHLLDNQHGVIEADGCV